MTSLTVSRSLSRSLSLTGPLFHIIFRTSENAFFTDFYVTSSTTFLCPRRTLGAAQVVKNGV